MALLALAGPAAAQTSVPVSDTWQGALFPEPNVGWVDDTSGLTATGEPYSTGSGIACPQSGQNTNIDHTTWYRLIGTGGRIVLSTNGFSNFDTLVTVYLANAQPNNSTAWLCHDDAGGAQLAELTFSSEAGATYYTQWGGCVNNAGCGNARGTLGYTILTNDQREYAAPAVSRTYANFGATVENSNEPTSCGGIAYGSTVWFRWQAPAKGHVTFSASRFDSVTAVYRGSNASYFACNDNAGGDVLRSEVSAEVSAGEVLLLQVGGKVIGTGRQDNFSLQVSFTEDLDVDGDGFAKRPGPDCDDGNPNIRPGARDVPLNGIDEDCSGRDSFDADGDGHERPPYGRDCNDGSRRVHPDAREVRGNFVDENCDGRRPAARLDPTPDVSFGSIAVLSGRRFGTLLLTGLGRGYRAVVRCSGAGSCPRRQQTKKVRRRGRLAFASFDNRVLRPGTAVEIFVTLPRANRFGHYERYEVRPPRQLVKRACLLKPRSDKRIRCTRG